MARRLAVWGGRGVSEARSRSRCGLRRNCVRVQAEQAERYDEMVEEMKKVAKMVGESELTVEERK